MSPIVSSLTRTTNNKTRVSQPIQDCNVIMYFTANVIAANWIARNMYMRIIYKYFHFIIISE